MIPDTMIRGYAGMPWAIVDFPEELQLKDKDVRVLLLLLRHLKQGSTLVSPSESYLMLKARCGERCLRYAIRRLEEKVGLVTLRARDRIGRYRGNIYDLAAVLKLLPEKTLKALKLSHLYRQKSADGAEQTEPKQPALDFEAQPGSDTAPEAPEQANIDPGLHRHSGAGPEQEQTMSAEQHTAPLGGETPAEKPQTEGQRVVASLRQVWPDGTRMGWAQAWLCYKARGAAICEDQIEALPYRKPKSSWAGCLRDSILKEVGGWDLPPKLLVARKNAAKAAIRAEAKAKEPDVAAAAPDLPPPAPPGPLTDWQRALALLAEHVNPPTLKTHLQPLDIAGADGDVVTLAGASHFSREWLLKRHRDHIQEALSAVLGRLITVRFAPPGDPSGEVPREPVGAAHAVQAPQTTPEGGSS